MLLVEIPRIMKEVEQDEYSFIFVFLFVSFYITFLVAMFYLKNKDKNSL